MPLVNHSEFLAESIKAGEKHSIIHVKNLSANARVGVDVWGRRDEGRVNKFQPVQISASIALKAPFSTAAKSDSVDGSTIHYGILSKEIMKVLAYRGEDQNAIRPGSVNGEKSTLLFIQQDWSLAVLLDAINSWLTGFVIDKGSYQRDWPYPELMARHGGGAQTIEEASIQELSLKCFLPKASILGTGVSLTVLKMPYIRHAPPAIGGPRKMDHTFCSILKLHDVRIPTLIGVNANEREAKQMVVANVEIDGYFLYHLDLYNKLEQIVVKTIEESSFDTLESLGTHLIKRIIKWFIYSEYDSFTYTSNELQYSGNSTSISMPSSNGEFQPQFRQLVTVSLEKPSAVMFADSPVVEVRRHADPVLDKTGISRPLVEQMGALIRRTNKHRTKLPFPLQGRLENWIRDMDPYDTTL